MVLSPGTRLGVYQVTAQGGSDGRYLPTGTSLYALGGVVFAVPFDLRQLEGPASTKRLGTGAGTGDAELPDPGLAVDGRQFLGVVTAGSAAASGAAPQIQVVLDWTEELKQLVLTR